MSLSEQYNIGARVKVRTSIGNASVTQSSGAAPSATTGESVDRNAAGLRRYYSCKAVVTGFFTGASSAKTASATINVQHSSDGTSWESYSTATVPAASVWGATSSGYAGGTTAGTETDSIEQSVNLRGARRYLRIQLPAPTYSDCSSGSVLAVHGLFVFGGADELPAQ